MVRLNARGNQLAHDLRMAALAGRGLRGAIAAGAAGAVPAAGWFCASDGWIFASSSAAAHRQPSDSATVSASPEPRGSRFCQDSGRIDHDLPDWRIAMVQRAMAAAGMHPGTRSNGAEDIGACLLHRLNQWQPQGQVRGNRGR